MDDLVDVFRAAYIGVGAHPRLLFHAVEEVRSYVRRIYSIIRLVTSSYMTVRHIVVECNHLARTRNDIFGRCGVVKSFQFHPEFFFKMLIHSEFYSKF